MVLVISAFLSIFLLTAGQSYLLAARAQKSLEHSIAALYIAEAGLAYGKAYCRSLDPWPPSPLEPPQPDEVSPSLLNRWVDWGQGRFYLRALSMPEESPSPHFSPERGVLLIATGAVGERSRKVVYQLLEEPPDCRSLSWWEPD